MKRKKELNILILVAIIVAVIILAVLLPKKPFYAPPISVYSFLSNVEADPSAYTIVAGSVSDAIEIEASSELAGVFRITNSKMDYEVAKQSNFISIGSPDVNSLTKKFLEKLNIDKGAVVQIFSADSGYSLIVAGLTPQDTFNALGILKNYKNYKTELNYNALKIVDSKVEALKCSDGTLYDYCSALKPKYCEDGNLIDKCQLCSCSVGTCQTDGTCGIKPTAITITRDLSKFLGANKELQVSLKLNFGDKKPVAIGVTENTPKEWEIKSCSVEICKITENKIEVLLFSATRLSDTTINYKILPLSSKGSFDGTWESVSPDLSGAIAGDSVVGAVACPTYIPPICKEGEKIVFGEKDEKGCPGKLKCVEGCVKGSVEYYDCGLGYAKKWEKRKCVSEEWQDIMYTQTMGSSPCSCADNSVCASGYECKDGKCSEKVVIATCKEAELKCEGNNLMLCKDNKFVLKESCKLGCDLVECTKFKCEDSDGGIKINVKGKIRYEDSSGISSVEDQCIDGKIREYYCASDGVKSTDIVCGECSAGVCIKQFVCELNEKKDYVCSDGTKITKACSCVLEQSSVKKWDCGNAAEQCLGEKTVLDLLKEIETNNNIQGYKIVIGKDAKPSDSIAAIDIAGRLGITDTILDSNAEAFDKMKRFITVGGSCVNKKTASLSGLNYPSCGKSSNIPENEAVIRTVKEAESITQLIVAGWEAINTRQAGRVIADETLRKKFESALREYKETRVHGKDLKDIKAYGYGQPVIKQEKEIAKNTTY